MPFTEQFRRADFPVRETLSFVICNYDELPDLVSTRKPIMMRNTIKSSFKPSSDPQIRQPTSNKMFFEPSRV